MCPNRPLPGPAVGGFGHRVARSPPAGRRGGGWWGGGVATGALVTEAGRTERSDREDPPVSSVILSVVAGERVPDPVRTTPSTNPANTADVVGTIGSAGADVFAQAAAAAKTAQYGWAALPAPQRG